MAKRKLLYCCASARLLLYAPSWDCTYSVQCSPQLSPPRVNDGSAAVRLRGEVEESKKERSHAFSSGLISILALTLNSKLLHLCASLALALLVTSPEESA